MSFDEFSGGKPVTRLGAASAPAPAPTAAPKAPGFLQNVADDFHSRVDSAADSQVSNQGMGSKILQTVGQGAGFVGDIGMDALKAVTPEPIKQVASGAVQAVASTGSAQHIESLVSTWAKAHPEAAKNLESIVNIAGLIPVAKGVGVAEDAAKTVATKAAGAVKEGVDGAISAITPGVNDVANLDKHVRTLVTPIQTTGKNGVLTSNIKAGRVEEGGVLKNRVITPSAKQIAIENEVKTVPGIKPGQTHLEANNLVHDEIGQTANNLRSQLKNRDVQLVVTRSDWDNFAKSVKSEISQNPLLVGDAEATAQKIFNKFQSLLPKGKDITAEHVLDARQSLDTWLKSAKGGTVFDPKTENALSVSLRAVRQGANDLLISKAPDVEVEKLLKRQTLLYNAIDNIAPKAAKEAQNGVSRFMQNHPRLEKVLKYGAGAVVGGGVAGAVVH